MADYKETDVIRYFEQTLAQCRDSMQSIRAIWKANQRKYMCEADFSKKKEWQFKIVPPITKPKTKRATNLIKTTLLRAGEYFDFSSPELSTQDPRYQQDILRRNYTKRLVKAHLDARPCDFVTNFSESLESAFGWSSLLLMKFWVGYTESGYFDMPRNEYVKEKTLALKSKAIDPFLFDFLPNRSVQIEHEYTLLTDLWAAVEKGDFDEKVVKKLTENDYGDSHSLKEEEEERFSRLNIDVSNKSDYHKEVLLSHFWGPLIVKDGKSKNKFKVVNPHCHFIVANEKYLLTEVQDNIYSDKSTPYVIDPVIKVPFRHVGKSLCEDVNSIEDAIVSLVNMQADNGLWQLLGITEIDQMNLSTQDKYQFKELYPGVPIVRRPGATQLAFTRHEMGTDPSRAMPLLQELKSYHDADHGVTDIISANGFMPGIPPEQLQLRMDALTQFEGFATDLERGAFTMCIDKARDRVVQFMCDPQSDPNAQTIIGQIGGIELDNMSEEDRKALIVSEYQIVARGISIIFERMRKQNQYTGLYKTMNAWPEEAKEWVRWKTFIPKSMEIIAVDCPQDFINTQEEVDANRQAKMQQQQMMMQMEIQKVLKPLETKLQQTQMGIQERLTALQQKLQVQMQTAMMQIGQKEQAAKLKQASDAIALLMSESQHRDKMDRQDVGMAMTKEKDDNDQMLAMLQMLIAQETAKMQAKNQSKSKGD